MPTIEDNIPDAIRAVLEDRTFVDQENAAVRSILESPSDAARRYEAGKMYERFGLLCPALHAYQQALALQPGHEKAAARAKRLEAERVNPDDEDGLYQLPQLDGSSDAAKQEATEPNLVGMIRLGQIARPSDVRLFNGSKDNYWCVVQSNNDIIRLRSRDGRIVLMAIAGVLSFLGFLSWIIWCVVQQVTKDESLGRPSRMTAQALGLLSFGLASLVGLRFFNNVITIHADGTIEEKAGIRPTVRSQLRKGSRVCLNLDYRTANSQRHILVTIVDEQNVVMKDISMSLLEQPYAPFQVRLAASIASLLDIPLEVAGSIRFNQPELRKWLGKLNDAMQPYKVGGSA